LLTHKKPLGSNHLPAPLHTLNKKLGVNEAIGENVYETQRQDRPLLQPLAHRVRLHSFAVGLLFGDKRTYRGHRLISAVDPKPNTHVDPN